MRTTKDVILLFEKKVEEIRKLTEKYGYKDGSTLPRFKRYIINITTDFLVITDTKTGRKCNFVAPCTQGYLVTMEHVNIINKLQGLSEFLHDYHNKNDVMYRLLDIKI